jgi:DivIVA domain-containing protein
MDLTPQTLHAVEFREARRGGYNTRDVDDFLEQVAAGVQSLHDRVRESMMRAESAEARVVEAHRQLDDAQRRPNDVTETDDTLRRTLVLAQRTADATIKEAKDEAARLLSESREEAAQIRAEIEVEARRGTEGARLAAEAEVEALLEARDALQHDIGALNDVLRQQRERVRAGITELERVLDDPNLLQASGGLALADVVGPNETGRHARVELPEPPPAPALTPAGADRDSGYDSSNGYDSGNGYVHEPAVPFLPGNQVASLHEAPLPARGHSELAPTPSSPFAFNGSTNGAANGSANGSEIPAPGPAAWPSQLRTSLDDDPANGKDAGFDPGSRPSEWGRPVFDRHDGGDPPSPPFPR